MNNLKEKIKDLLRGSEKYTKTDTLYLFSGGFWVVVSQVVVSLAAFLLSLAFANLVAKEDYGQYKYVLSVSSILGAFTLSGLGTAVTQSVARGYEGTLGYSFWKSLRWSFLFALLALGVSIYYFVNDNEFLGISMLIVGSVSPWLWSTNLYNAYLNAKKDFKRSAIYFNMVGNVVPAACLFGAILLTDDPIWFVATYFVSNAFIGIILYRRVLHIYRPNKEIDREALAYGKHLSFMNILSIIAYSFDQVLAFHYLGAVGVATYNFAVAIPNQIKGPIKGFTSIIFPKFSERDSEDIERGLNHKMALLGLLAVAMILAYFLTAPYIFELLFPEYMESVIYSQIFSLSFLRIIAVPAGTYLLAKKKVKEQYIVNIASPVFQLVCLIGGMILGGLQGLVIGRVVSTLAMSGLTIAMAKRNKIEV